MNFLTRSLSRFAKLSLRERLLAAAAVAAVLYFATDLVLLQSQQKVLSALRQRDKSNKADAAAIDAVLADMDREAAKGEDPMGKDLASIAELKRQIADASVFLSGSDEGTAQMGALVREMLAASPRLTLVSLKTVPVTTFYTPGKEAAGSGKPEALVEFQKTIYRHGAEVVVKGSYLELLSYLEKLQNYPGRLFWSEVRLDVATYPEAVLKMAVYTLSDQSSMSLH